MPSRSYRVRKCPPEDRSCIAAVDLAREPPVQKMKLINFIAGVTSLSPEELHRRVTLARSAKDPATTQQSDQEVQDCVPSNQANP
jgi:hypothetical protein